MSLLVIDAHVHIYDCFDLSRFFDAAFSNSLKAAREHDDEQPHVPMLLLSEGNQQMAFQRFSEERKNGKDLIGEKGSGRYRVSTTEEAESLRIEKGTGEYLFLISGRQIATSEGLEVLALATASRISDGLELEETVEEVVRQGALAAIPWSFGKWYGRRGKVLRKFLASYPHVNVFLGDNGGRPTILRFPGFHRDIIGGPLKILRGSDPLPLPAETDKVGGFGFILREHMDLLRPAESLKRILSMPDVEPVPYGFPEKLSRFARNQFLLRTWKHRI